MAKAKVKEEVEETVEAAEHAPAPAPDPDAVPAGHVRIILKDSDERGIDRTFTVPVYDRDRVYHTPHGDYSCSREDADGSFIYRRNVN